MKKQLLLLILGLVAVLLAAGQLARAAAGPGPNDIQDSLPSWTSDGVRVLFERNAPNLEHTVTMTSAGKELSVAWPSGHFRGTVPRSKYFLVEESGKTIMTLGGRFAGPRAIFHGVDATASPDGTRVAYLRDGTLYVAQIDDLGPEFPVPTPPERAIATGIVPPSWDIRGPVWSPDGTRIVIASGSSLVLVRADGTGSQALFSGANQSVNPSWSPDGAEIVFERNASAHWQIWTVSPSEGDARVWLSGVSNFRYPTFSPLSNTLAFISDKQHLKGGATEYQFALYVQPPTGVARKLVDDVHPNSPPAWSPTAALIAVAAGQECRRWGIYVGRSNVGSRFTRRSNLCRFDGTAGDDAIRGSYFFDIINGLGGNDRILGLDGNDKILGENGNDTIFAGNGNDVVFGGPGDDVIFGGAGNDLIIPGNGRDRVDCGPGVDTVEGAGPLDTIAKNCEHIRR